MHLAEYIFKGNATLKFITILFFIDLFSVFSRSIKEKKSPNLFMNSFILASVLFFILAFFFLP